MSFSYDHSSPAGANNNDNNTLPKDTPQRQAMPPPAHRGIKRPRSAPPVDYVPSFPDIDLTPEGGDVNTTMLSDYALHILGEDPTTPEFTLPRQDQLLNYFGVPQEYVGFPNMDNAQHGYSVAQHHFEDQLHANKSGYQHSPQFSYGAEQQNMQREQAAAAQKNAHMAQNRHAQGGSGQLGAPIFKPHGSNFKPLSAYGSGTVSGMHSQPAHSAFTANPYENQVQPRHVDPRNFQRASHLPEEVLHDEGMRYELQIYDIDTESPSDHAAHELNPASILRPTVVHSLAVSATNPPLNTEGDVYFSLGLMDFVDILRIQYPRDEKLPVPQPPINYRSNHFELIRNKPVDPNNLDDENMLYRFIHSGAIYDPEPHYCCGYDSGNLQQWLLNLLIDKLNMLLKQEADMRPCNVRFLLHRWKQPSELMGGVCVPEIIQWLKTSSWNKVKFRVFEDWIVVLGAMEHTQNIRIIDLVKLITIAHGKVMALSAHWGQGIVV